MRSSRPLKVPRRGVILATTALYAGLAVTAAACGRRDEAPAAALVAPAEADPLAPGAGEVEAPLGAPAGPSDPAAADVPAGDVDGQAGAVDAENEGGPGDAAEPGADAVAPPGLPVAPEVPGAPDGRVRLTRLTEPGCCVQPAWTADSGRVAFIDRPDPAGPVGIWAVGADAPGAAPELVTEDVAGYSADPDYRVERDGARTTVVRLSDGARWDVPAAGRPVSFSPDRTQLAWVDSPQNVPSERRTARVWVSAIDGTGAREVAALPRGTLSGWLSDDTLLVRGRDDLAADDEVLSTLSLADGRRREIARAERLRGELVSPGGSWVVYYVAQSREPSANGLWLASTAGGAPRRLGGSLFGAYRWRDDATLLVVPLRGADGVHQLVSVDAATLAATPLTDPATTTFKIANGDWTVSPDGRRVVFVDARDDAIWVMELPAR